MGAGPAAAAVAAVAAADTEAVAGAVVGAGTEDAVGVGYGHRGERRARRRGSLILATTTPAFLAVVRRAIDEAGGIVWLRL